MHKCSITLVICLWKEIFSEMVAIEAARICTGTEVTGDNQDIKLLKKTFRAWA